MFVYGSHGVIAKLLVVSRVVNDSITIIYLTEVILVIFI